MDSSSVRPDPQPAPQSAAQAPHEPAPMRVIARLTNRLAEHRTGTAIFSVMLALVLLGIDFAAPHYIEFSITYAIVVAFATQFVGWKLGVALTLLLPIGHLLSYFASWQQPYPLSGEMINLALLLFVCGATVYLIETAKRMAALRQENVRLETLRQTMVTVNDIVLNRLQVMQFVMHLAAQNKSLTPEQAQLAREALDEVVVKLRDLSSLDVYTTEEVTKGVHAVVLPEPPTPAEGPLVPPKAGPAKA